VHGPLGVHQRLDAESSGVMVFSRSERGARCLARQFEVHSVRKVYRTLHLRQPALSTHPQTFEDVLDAASPERLARSQYRSLRTLGPYSLAELEIETGRTHQIRRQLANRQAPILGDSKYGGGSGTGRMLLHAYELSFNSPNGERLCFRAPLPELLDEHCSLAALLRAIAQTLSTPEHPQQALRVAELGDLGLPELRLDRYGPALALRRYVPNPKGHSLWEDDALELLADAACERLGCSAAYLFDHLPHAGPRAEGGTLLCGEALDEPFEVREAGARFEVSMNDGLGCGLYLDQHDNRQWLREQAAGARVLNLFAYTSSFSVAAALGGAAACVSVDLSRKAMRQAQRNFELNAIDPSLHQFIADDCFDYLRRAQRRGLRFDLVVCDPPSFARNGKRHFSLARQLDALMLDCLRMLSPGGRLLFCSNHREISPRRLEQALLNAAHQRTLGMPQSETLGRLPETGSRFCVLRARFDS
ncbi:MAG: class I SAM-dependent methyltransferase, partial [Myxococcota bacterium]|nr:class I SAM-dependent methyltransferase [Myxococcota bacterium]